MKNVKVLVISSISFLLIGGAFALGIHGFQTIDTKGDPAAAGLTITPESIVDGNVATRYGNEVTIRGEYSKSSTIDLGANGYIGNFNVIRGMHSLNVTFEGTGSLECWVGYKQGILYQVSSSISSGASVSLPSDPEARFFKLQASEGAVNISSINIDISCPGLEGEATERLTGYSLSDGVINGTNVTGGSALSVFDVDDGVSNVSFNANTAAIKTLTIKGSIPTNSTFNSTTGGLYFLDLSELTGYTSLTTSKHAFGGTGSALKKIFLPSALNSVETSVFPYGTSREVFVNREHGGVSINTKAYSGIETAAKATIRYFYPGSGELAEGINYWVYNALNEPIAYTAA